MPLPIAHMVYDAVAPVPTDAAEVLTRLDCEEFSSIAIYGQFVLGDLDDVTVTIEFSYDGDTWYTGQAWTWDATANNRQTIDIVDKYARISILGSGVVNDDSSLIIELNMAPR